MLSLLTTLLVSALAFAQADVAGNWRVEFVVPTGERTVIMTINQKGTAISGRVVNEDGEFPMEGKIAGDQVTAEWLWPEQGEQIKITMSGDGPGRRHQRRGPSRQCRRGIAVRASTQSKSIDRNP
jgi:hypothetical protein